MPTAGSDTSTSDHPGARLGARLAAATAPTCVGIDPVAERLPTALSREEPIEALGSFCDGILEAVAPSTPVVKIQSACFERYGAPGVALLERVTRSAVERGFQVILDAKRGDIGISAEHYAVAAAKSGAHWVTVNGYLGEDGIRPFLDQGLGVFVLVRTSNPSGDEVQEISTKDGSTVAAHVATMVARISDAFDASDQCSSVGAVVGATKPQSAKALRELMPRQPFLLPGYGAQGGGPEGVTAALDASGGGVVVASSRGIIYAEAEGDETWSAAIARAAEAFATEIRDALRA